MNFMLPTALAPYYLHTPPSPRDSPSVQAPPSGPRKRQSEGLIPGVTLTPPFPLHPRY